MAAKKSTIKTKTSTKKTVKASPAKSTTRKPSSKAIPKTAVKETSVAAKAPEEKSQTQTKDNQKSVKFRKSYVVLIIAILLLGAGLYYFRGFFVAAVVNGQPVSRLEVVKQAEQQVGQQTLDTLVRNTLIEQKAKEQNVTVTDEEINEEINKLKENLQTQGQDLDQVLQAQGMSQEDLRRLIRLDKLVAKMVGKDVQVTEEEVNEYIDQNREAFPEDTSEEELQTQVEEQLKQQKTNEKVREWLAKIQEEANVIYFVQY